jgi:hypothetical protein
MAKSAGNSCPEKLRRFTMTAILLAALALSVADKPQPSMAVGTWRQRDYFQYVEYYGSWKAPGKLEPVPVTIRFIRLDRTGRKLRHTVRPLEGGAPKEVPIEEVTILTYSLRHYFQDRSFKPRKRQ